GLHVRRPAEGGEGAALDALPLASEPECGLLGGADGEGGGDVHDGQSPVPGRADAADERTGYGRDDVAGAGRQAAGDAAVGRAVRPAEGVAVLAEVTPCGPVAEQPDHRKPGGSPVFDAQFLGEFFGTMVLI